MIFFKIASTLLAVWALAPVLGASALVQPGLGPKRLIKLKSLRERCLTRYFHGAKGDYAFAQQVAKWLTPPAVLASTNYCPALAFTRDVIGSPVLAIFTGRGNEYFIGCVFGRVLIRILPRIFWNLWLR